MANLGLFKISNQEKENLRQSIAGVSGWLTNLEGELLYALAKNHSLKGIIVEIGSFKGRSTICLALGSSMGVKPPVYAVDPHTGSPECGFQNTLPDFMSNLDRAGLKDIVHPLIMTSQEAGQMLQEPISLLFIDGEHDYDCVQRDFDLWLPKLANNGWIVIHDSVLMAGPRKIADNLILKSGKFKKSGFIHSCTYAQKAHTTSPLERTHNYYVLVLKSFYFLTAKIKAPALLRRLAGKIIRFVQ